MNYTHLTMVNLMVCELYLNKPIEKLRKLSTVYTLLENVDAPLGFVTCLEIQLFHFSR